MKKYLLIGTIVLLLLSFIFYITFIYDSSYQDIDLSFSTNTIENISDTAYADTLLHVALDIVEVDNIHVNIINMGHRSVLFKDDDLTLNAFVDYLPNLRTYNVFIKERLSRHELLLALSHEAIHIRQYNNGDLKMLEYPLVFFRGDTLNANDIPYIDRPWEIEAFKKQNKVRRELRGRVL